MEVADCVRSVFEAPSVVPSIVGIVSNPRGSVLQAAAIEPAIEYFSYRPFRIAVHFNWRLLRFLLTR